MGIVEKASINLDIKGFKAVSFGWQSWNKCEENASKSRGIVLLIGKEESYLVGVFPDGRSLAPNIYLGEKIRIEGDFNKNNLVVLSGGREEIVKEFLKRSGFTKKILGKMLIYYTWPSLGRSVRANDVYKAIKNLKKGSVVLLDDGWEKTIGFWEVKSDFGEGLKTYANSLKNRGFVPGIWLAPFLRKDKKFGYIGKVRIGIESYFIVDPKLFEVKRYFYELGRKFSSLGFSFFKLDFLYAGVIQGNVSDYRKCMEEFRRGAGKPLIMGCGAPILESFGLFDMVRGSGDSTTYPFWTFGWMGILINRLMLHFRINERLFVKSFESFFIRKKYFGELENFIADGLVRGAKYGINEKIVDKYYGIMVKNEKIITLG